MNENLSYVRAIGIIQRRKERRHRLKTQITKCYLIQVLDDDGNEIECEYVFSDRKEAELRAKEMKDDAEKSRLEG